MIIAKVVGSVVATIKHECFQDKKLMLVKPLDRNGKVKSETIIAVDTVHAGKGDTVLVLSEGNSVTEIMEFDNRQPMRSIIVGIVDRIDWMAE
jgi:ethanolamine utilization protein EutN